MSSLIDRAWRLCATAISFAVFGIGGLVLALAVFPVLNVIVTDPQRRQSIAQRTVRNIWRLYIRMMVVLRVLTYECRGVDVLADEEGTMIIANHPSLLDVVFLMSLTKRAQCVVKAHVRTNPFMRGVVKATNYIVNLGDPQQLIDSCAGALRAGDNVIIFPEGSRTVAGEQRRMTRGFAHAAAITGAPVRLVTIICDPPTLRKGEPWYKVPQKRPHWTITVHERISEGTAISNLARPAFARRLCSDVERRFREILC